MCKHIRDPQRTQSVTGKMSLGDSLPFKIWWSERRERETESLADLFRAIKHDKHFPGPGSRCCASSRLVLQLHAGKILPSHWLFFSLLRLESTKVYMLYIEINVDYNFKQVESAKLVLCAAAASFFNLILIEYKSNQSNLLKTLTSEGSWVKWKFKLTVVLLKSLIHCRWFSV